MSQDEEFKQVLKEEALSRIKRAKISKANQLQLNSLGLTELPQEVFELSWLKKLDISNKPSSPFDFVNWGRVQFSRYIPGAFSKELFDNSLVTLPSQIKFLTELEILDVRFNQLTTLPPEIGELPNLKKLDVSANRLTKLPLEIGKLVELVELYIEYNELIDLPAMIGGLNNVTILHANNNRLKELPKNIGELSSLTFMDLSANQLTVLPVEIGRLSELIKLHLYENQLFALPNEICNLSKLEALDVSNNHLLTIPSNIDKLSKLTLLDLNHNNLSNLPPQMLKLTHLENLNIQHNPLPIPTEVQVKHENPNEVLNYYFQTQAGTSQISDQGKLTKVFLSYAHADKEIVEQLFHFLSVNGFDPWMDVMKIRGGQDWEHAIKVGIESSMFFIACLSKNSFDRRGVIQKEINQALNRWQEMLPDDAYLIPLRLEEVEYPERLKRFHAIDWYKPEGRKLLLETIKTELDRRG